MTETIPEPAANAVTPPAIPTAPAAAQPIVPGRGWAVSGYLLCEVFSVLLAGILMLTVGKRNDYLRFHTRQMMNLQLTGMLFGFSVAIAGKFVPAVKTVGMLSFVFFIAAIVAAVQAYQGKQARSPLALPLFK